MFMFLGINLIVLMTFSQYYVKQVNGKVNLLVAQLLKTGIAVQGDANRLWLYPSFQGCIRFLSLLFPSICPRNGIYPLLFHYYVDIQL